MRTLAPRGPRADSDINIQIQGIHHKIIRGQLQLSFRKFNWKYWRFFSYLKGKLGACQYSDATVLISKLISETGFTYCVQDSHNGSESNKVFSSDFLSMIFFRVISWIWIPLRFRSGRWSSSRCSWYHWLPPPCPPTTAQAPARIWLWQDCRRSRGCEPAGETRCCEAGKRADCCPTKAVTKIWRRSPGPAGRWETGGLGSLARTPSACRERTGSASTALR